MRDDVRTLLGPAIAELKAAGATEVYIFGSTVRKPDDLPSDIDIAVLGLPAGRFFELQGRLLRILNMPVDLVSLDKNTPFTTHLRESRELVRVG